MNALPCHLQVAAAVRLRRETWGGIAFDRAGGDLIELDAEGFAVLTTLKTPHSLPALQRSLRHAGHSGQRPELIAVLHQLEQHGFIRRVPPDVLPLPEDRCSPVGQASSLVRGPKRTSEDACPTAALSAPLVAHWAVTYRCNLHCPFCYSESGPHRSLGPESLSRQRLVQRLADWGVLEVALGGGEPTILPDFPELLAAIRAADMVPNVTTNGTVQSQAVLRALAEHAGVVHLSADRPNLLDTARGTGVFARLRETAGLLRASGVRLGVNLLLTPDNIGDIGRSLEAILDLGLQAVTFLRPKGEWAALHWPGFPAADDLARLADSLRAFMETKPSLRLYVDTALRGEWTRVGLLRDPEPEVLGCGGGQRHVAVTPEGDVYPCSHLRRPEYRLGNLLVDDLDEIWSQGAGRGRYLRDCDGVRCPCRSDGERACGQGLLPMLAR